ncbi:eCIS core domain-containing protein [Streptomyces zaomyceticus]|uniref:eCIS core domain-containing protein n=1 Tax=Streptomyces zaomyceticus TaxID=68286 RepID=UPI003F4D76A9
MLHERGPGQDTDRRSPITRKQTPTGEAALPALQRSAGNAAVLHMLQRAGHPYAEAQEQHRHNADCGHRKNEPAAVQRSAVHDVLSGAGRPLDTSLRAEMESRLGADFSDVRVHDDGAARASSAEIGARAYTSGSHVVLGAGGGDKHTLAHELTHVIQQRQGPVSGTDHGNGLQVSDPGDRFERAAEANAVRVMRGPAPTAAGAGGTPAPGSPGAAVAGPSAPAPVQRADNGGESSRSAQPNKGKGRQTEQDRRREEEEEEELERLRQLEHDLNKEETASGVDEDSETDEEVRKDLSKTALLSQAHGRVKGKARAYGSGYLGRITDDVRARFPRSKENERSSQTLTHLSLAMYDAMEAAQDARVDDSARVDNREVQGMLINGRLLFAANFDESVDAMDDGKAATLRHMLDRRQGDEERDAGLDPHTAFENRERIARARAKLREIDEGRRDVRGQDSTANALRTALDTPVVIVDSTDENLHEYLTADQYMGRAFLVRVRAERDRSKKAASVHAEQKLLLLLHKAGLQPDEVGGPLLIQGRYRPCVGCSAALRHYRKKFENLEYNPRHGFYWRSSLLNLAQHQEHVLRGPEFMADIDGMTGDAHGGGLMSTSTDSTAALDGWKEADGDPEMTIGARNAEKRGWVTASDSEVDAVTGRSRKRDRKPFDPTQVTRGVGEGKEAGTAKRYATPQDVQELRAAKKSGDRGKQKEVYGRFASVGGGRGFPLSRAEIGEIVGVSGGHIGRIIGGLTGHEKRDAKVPEDQRRKRKLYTAPSSDPGTGKRTRRTGRKHAAPEREDSQPLVREMAAMTMEETPLSRAEGVRGLLPLLLGGDEGFSDFMETWDTVALRETDEDRRTADRVQEVLDTLSDEEFDELTLLLEAAAGRMGEVAATFRRGLFRRAWRPDPTPEPMSEGELSSDGSMAMGDYAGYESDVEEEDYMSS